MENGISNDNFEGLILVILVVDVGASQFKTDTHNVVNRNLYDLGFSITALQQVRLTIYLAIKIDCQHCRLVDIPSFLINSHCCSQLFVFLAKIEFDEVRTTAAGSHITLIVK